MHTISGGMFGPALFKGDVNLTNHSFKNVKAINGFVPITEGDVSNISAANKIIRADGTGKLPVDITGKATGLTTARTITVSTDATGSVSFDGTANVTLALTLANSGATAGTYRSVTVDAKGRVTAGTNPTTLSGYGITDAVSLTGTQTLTNKTLTAPVFGGTITQDYYARRTIDLGNKFTNTVANEKFKLTTPATNIIIGEFKISLTALWANVNTSGVIEKTFSVYTTGGGSPNINSQRTSYTKVEGEIANFIAISDVVLNAGNLEITISKIGTGDTLNLRMIIEQIAVGVGYFTAMNNFTVGAIYTTDVTVPALPVLQTRGQTIWHAGNFDPTTKLGATANAASATKLATARTITVSTDATGSVSFDGTANVTLALTLANSGVTAGTYRSVTVDAKGRVTAGTNPTTITGYGITDAYTKTEMDAKVVQDVRATASPTFVSPIVTTLKVGGWEFKQNADGSLGFFKN